MTLEVIAPLDADSRADEPPTFSAGLDWRVGGDTGERPSSVTRGVQL